MRCRWSVVAGLLLLAALPQGAGAHDGHFHGRDPGGWRVSPAIEGFPGLPMPVPAGSRAAARAAQAAPGSITLVGHNALLNRGMNAGLALHGNYAYVGSRTDGTHVNAGVLVVDISDPANPAVVHEIGAPNEANSGETSRELRVWPEQNLLMVLNFACGSSERCSSANPRQNVRFYDIAGANAAAPKLVATRLLSHKPHEMFLWDDPARPGRAILYLALFKNNPSMLLLDVSRAREGVFTELARLSMSVPASSTGSSAALHSFSVSVDGTRAYLADYGGGFLIANTSQVASAAANPSVTLVTPVANRVARRRDPGAHSAVKLPGRSYAFVTEETYSPCPWGWAYTIDIASPTSPRYLAPYRTLPFNDAAWCSQAPRPAATKTAHNPTLTRNVALVNWHSRGLQAISLENPAAPARLAEFVPVPLPTVSTEDQLTPGSAAAENVAFWSYPVIRNGLIYAIDVRNGLYVLRYNGPLEAEIANRTFLEGNSNLGDAAALAAG
jgi:hypothetical protein